MQKFSRSTETSQRDQENKQFEMEFKYDYEEYKQRLNTYDNNMIEA